jgi:hypothetical protein
MADRDPGHRLPLDLEPLDDRPDGRRDDDDQGSGLGQGRLLWLVAGAGAIAAGTALGWNADALSAVVTPPPLIRAALAGLAVAIGVVLLMGALERLSAAPTGGRADRDRDTGLVLRPRLGTARDVATMIRGVRLVFLAVAAFAAASGWLLGHPLPLVIAFVIAGVDVLETSFLLLVVSLRSRG